MYYCVKCKRDVPSNHMINSHPEMVDIADVRNKLTPMLTVLELIKEFDVCPKDDTVKTLWDDVVLKARQSIDYIKNMKGEQ